MGALVLLNKFAAVIVLILAIYFGLKAIKFGFKALAVVVVIIALQTLIR